VLEAVKVIRDAFGIESTLGFVTLMAVACGVVGAGVGWLVDSAYKNSHTIEKQLESAKRDVETERGRADGLQREVVNLKRQLDASVIAKGGQISQVAKFLMAAEELERRCIAERGSFAVEKRSVEFYNEVATYLKEHLGEDYVARFKAAMADGGQDKFPFDKTALLGRIRGRKVFLAQLLQELRARDAR